MYTSASGAVITNFLWCLSQLYLSIYWIESHKLLHEVLKINMLWFSFHVLNFHLQGLNFRVEFWNSHPKFRNPRRKESWRRETSALKNARLSRNFCFYEMKLLISKKFTGFHVTLDNFLVSVVISYYWSEVIIFVFCH